MAKYLVRNSIALEGYGNHVLLRAFHGLFDRYRRFSGLTFTDTDAAFAISDYNQRTEIEPLSAFYDFGNAIQLYQLILQLLAFTICLSYIFLSQSILRFPLRLELKSLFTSCISQCLNTPVIFISATVENNVRDLLTQRLFRDARTDFFRCIKVSAMLHRGADFLLKRRCG